VADDRELLERIQALTDAMAEGPALPRCEMEPIVTDGYARALEFDAECLRIERRIDELTHDTVVVGHDMERGELSALVRRLHEATRQSTELRELLAPLRKIVSRAAA
jgi:Mg2+ and Co2+ transporter CorA